MAKKRSGPRAPTPAADPAVVRYRKNFSSPVPADVAYAELERLRAANPEGAVLTAATVRAATARTHPLHPHFTWDNTTAAHQHRLQQARALIRAVVLVSTKRPAAKPVPVYLNVRSPGPAPRAQRYLLTATVMADPAARTTVLREALDRLKAVREKYAHLTELAAVYGAIDAAEAQAG